MKKKIAHKIGCAAIEVRTGFQNAALLPKIIRLKETVWPGFFLGPFWKQMELIPILLFPNYQYTVINKENNDLVAYLNALPLHLEEAGSLSPRGYNFCIENSLAAYFVKKTALSAIAASIAPAYQGKGLAEDVVDSVFKKRTLYLDGVENMLKQQDKRRQGVFFK